MQDSWLSSKADEIHSFAGYEEGYEEVLWCAKDSLWSPEPRNHPSST